MNVTAIVTCMTEAELPFVREAIYSVQAQTCTCELLVIVPEGNVTILSYFRSFGSAFTLYPVPMFPVAIVRNLGVARATTEWVAFLDGDDVWTPTKTERQLAAARAVGSPFVGTRHLLIREDGTPFFYAFAKRMPMPSSWLVKRDLLIENPFCDWAEHWDDAELWNRIEGKGIRTYTLKDYCLHYRVRNLSASTGYAPKRRKDRFAKMSTIVGMRPALLISSRVWSLLNPPLNTRRPGVIEKRVRKLDIRDLTRDEKNRFADNWKETQARFVDAPSPAVSEADGLVKELMLARRYPVSEFEQRAADISVDYPNVVNNYRNAREIAERNKSGKATTEDLRQAMVHYRSLFAELLETTAARSRTEQTSTGSNRRYPLS